MTRVELHARRRRAAGEPGAALETMPVADRARSERGERPRPRPLPIETRELAVDALMLLAAAGASALGARSAGLPPVALGWLLAFSLGVLALLAFSGAYRHRFTLHFLEDFRAILAATAIAAMSITFLRVLLTDDALAASEAVRGWLFAATYLAAGRAGMELVLASMRRRGERAEQTLIVGAGEVGQLVARRLIERPEFGLHPAAFLDDNPLELAYAPDVPVLGTGQGPEIDDRRAFATRLERVIRDFGIGHVIVTFSLSSHETELELVRRCQELGVSVSLVPRLFEGIPDQTTLERIGGLPLISVHPSDPRGWQFAVKYGLDRVLALVVLILLSPIMVAAAIGTLLTLGRPILFRQRRVGLDGRSFEMLKFRTMRTAADPAAPDEEDLDEGIAPGGVEGEDRRSRFGAALRRFSIDELPQLLNVMRGEMSMIGPRPERVEYAQEFDRRVYRYEDRHRVKSGITGWAQVHGLRGKTSLADRVEWDNYYVENWSLWLDLKIVFLTVPALLKGSE
jgi:exopolysaccharide biosynthesis polyprenyl glycosylphosphotransferase